MLAELITKFAVISFAVLALAAATNDMLTLRIPNLINAAMVVCFAVFVVSVGPQWPHVLSVALAVAVFALGAGAFSRGWVGGGDVKMLAVVSLWAGPGLLAPTLIIIVMTGGLLALFAVTPVWRAWRWMTVPLGGTGLVGANGKAVIPYGLAIACGALFVAQRMLGLNLL